MAIQRFFIMPAPQAKTDQIAVYNHEERAACPPGMKLCQSSYHEGARILPADPEHFYRNKNRWDGFSTVCKICWRKQREDLKTRKVEDKEKKAVKSVITLARKHANVPHMTELVETMMSKLQGVEGFVDLFVDDLLAANPGTPHRLHAELAICNLIVKNTEAGHAQKPLDLYTDEELAEYLTSQQVTIENAKQQLLEEPEEDDEMEVDDG